MVTQPVRSSEEVLEAELTVASMLTSSNASLADAVREILRIERDGLWRHHVIRGEDGMEKPLYTNFFDGPNGYMAQRLLPLLRRDVRTRGLRSLGSWKDLLRAVKSYDPFGITVEEILASNGGVLRRLESCLVFERGTRHVHGFSDAVLNLDLVPPPPEWDGVSELSEMDLIRGLVYTVFDLTAIEARRLLNSIMNRREIVFVVNDNDGGDFHALVFYPTGAQALRRFEYRDFSTWPEFLKQEFKARLRLKTYRNLLASPLGATIAQRQLEIE